MDRFLRPSGAVYLVVAVVFIGLLAGLPSWAAKSATKATQSAPVPAESAPKKPTIDHTASGHSATAHPESSTTLLLPAAPATSMSQSQD